MSSSFAKSLGSEVLEREEATDEQWQKFYHKTQERIPGPAEGVLARAPAQVMRLAALYALMDMSTVIGRKHLRAAESLWTYSKASALYLPFGKGGTETGLPGRILRSLHKAGSDGITARDLSHNHNRPPKQIEAALEDLKSSGLVASESKHAGKSGGRPTKRWHLVAKEP